MVPMNRLDLIAEAHTVSAIGEDPCLGVELVEPECQSLTRAAEAFYSIGSWQNMRFVPPIPGGSPDLDFHAADPQSVAMGPSAVPYQILRQCEMGPLQTPRRAIASKGMQIDGSIANTAADTPSAASTRNPRGASQASPSEADHASVPKSATRACLRNSRCRTATRLRPPQMP